MKVRLKRDFEDDVDGICDLSTETAYEVLGIEADDYRIVDDAGDPVLFSPHLFDIVDPSEPLDWVSNIGDEGERYAYPAELNEVGFFERYFDGDVTTVQTLSDYLRRRPRL